MRNMHALWAIGLLLPALAACATAKPPAEPPVASAPASPEPCAQTGTASWYRVATKRKTTASGTAPGSATLVAAHPTLPFGTQVLVTVLSSGRSVVVRIADRGPFTKGRIIDLSPAAAAELGMHHDGVVQVRLEIYQPPSEAVGVQPAAITNATCPFRQNAAA
jgi:rare lipoprotein A